MAIPLGPLCLSDSAAKARAWQYSRPLGRTNVELGTVRGFDVGLPIHFHDEDQITFVLSGSRRFVINGELIRVAPDEGRHIPAGVPHRSLAEDAELFCINIYKLPGEGTEADLISNLACFRRRHGFLDWTDLTTIIEEHCTNAGLSSTQMCEMPSGIGQWHTVSEAAHFSGMSREAFSRRFRRLHGIPPQAFQLLEKLNDARRLLRKGDSIADVAVQTGFADQSHLGRLFRRAFGVTPGRYRAG